MRGVLHTTTSSPTPTGCPATQFSSDTVTRGEHRPPQDCPHFRLQPQMRCPGHPPFCPADYKPGASCDPPPSGLMIHWNDSKNLEKHVTYIHWFITKGTNQGRPNGREAQGNRWGGMQSLHAFWGGACPSGPQCVHQPEAP